MERCSVISYTGIHYGKNQTGNRFHFLFHFSLLLWIQFLNFQNSNRCRPWSQNAPTVWQQNLTKSQRKKEKSMPKCKTKFYLNLNVTRNSIFQSHLMHSEFSAFTMDVIARCAFGMTIENLGGKDDPFMNNAKVIFNPYANKTPLILLPCKWLFFFVSRL